MVNDVNSTKKIDQNTAMGLTAKNLCSLGIKNAKISYNGANNIVVTVTNPNQANSIIDCKNLTLLKVTGGSEVKQKRHGVIHGIDTMFEIEDIKANMTSPVPIVDARRLQRRVSNKVTKQVEYVDTQSIQITFEGKDLPPTVRIYENWCNEVHVYIPNVKLCYKCFRYGHSSKVCNSKQTCMRCGANDHTKDKCSADEEQCVNCSGNHSATSRECPEYLYNKELTRIAATDNVS